MEENVSSPAMKKAMLIAGGPVLIPEDFKLPFHPSRSTAGPGAGKVSIVFSFEGLRVKKEISREHGEFELVRSDQGLSLWREGRVFVEKVEIQPTIFHSPEQAFFNLDTDCIYDCKFCSSRKLDKRIVKNLDLDRIVDLVLKASERKDFKAVAFTSAVVDSPSKSVGRMCYVITRVREQLDPSIPIGVEPYVGSFDDIDRLRAAGADEIKINIETYDRTIFQKICGKLDFDWIMKAIGYAAQIFGVGRVCSNIIIGLGETDENVLEGVDALARIGCVATLRPLRVNDLNRRALEEAIGPLQPVKPERMIRLAEEQRMIFDLYDLDPRSFRTMCHSCTCCDIVPYIDL